MSALNRNNVWLSPILLIISGLGIGGIVVPASIISTIICPDELIATIAALTLSIRVLGGAIGYTIYYNIFVQHFIKNVTYYVGGACVENGINSTAVITEVIGLTGTGLINEILELPGVDGNQTKWEILVYAGQLAYAKSYPYVYYVSLAFGITATICSVFLKDIKKHMTDHIAVHMEDKTPEPRPSSEQRQSHDAVVH
jgi:MFS family permease